MIKKYARSIFLIIAIYAIYEYLLIEYFWITTNNVTEVERIQHYSGVIQNIDCESQGVKIYLKITPVTDEILYFRVLGEIISCSEIEGIISIAKGSRYEGYFIGSAVMSFSIANNVIVHFSGERKRSREFVIFFSIAPIVAVILVFFVRWRKSRKISRCQPA